MTTKTSRVMIFIDGSNFYFKLKDLKLHQQLEFDFSGFGKFLSRERQLVKMAYYIGKIRTDGTEKTKTLFDSQQRLLSHLKMHRIHYSLGYLLKSAGVFHEKGVDVQIAVDMLVAAYENQAEKLIIVSSDTDLIPAIKKARQKGKKVEYVGFSHQASIAMIAGCDESRLLTREDLLPFLSVKSAIKK